MKFIYEHLWWYWFAYKTELFVFISIAIIGWLIYCFVRQQGFGVG